VAILHRAGHVMIEHHGHEVILAADRDEHGMAVVAQDARRDLLAAGVEHRLVGAAHVEQRREFLVGHRVVVIGERGVVDAIGAQRVAQVHEARLVRYPAGVARHAVTRVV
jgi:hypothetical protein